MNKGATGIRRLARSRRLLLTIAALAGVVVAVALADCAQRSTPHPRTQPAAPVIVRIVSDAAAQTTPEPPPKPSDSETPAPAKGTRATVKGDVDGTKIDAEISIDHRGVTIRKREGATDHESEVIVGDQEFESFEQFVEQAPWLAALVFLVVSLIFLVPLLVIALVIWYKMRRTRMMNETMLKLAERGVVPPGEAMGAIASANPAAALQTAPTTAPLYEQARQFRKREAWSDLRKGVILAGIGLGLVMWSMLNDAEANGFGLILLFVGIGYLVLWRFEERQLGPSAGGSGDGTGKTTGDS